jgi:hypothetical protein
MAKQRDEPRISVNKLAQYVTSRATRQNQILRTAKFPPDYITTYYREAAEAIARFLAGGMVSFSILEPIQKLVESDESDVIPLRGA